jgi:hypothetical protein
MNAERSRGARRSIQVAVLSARSSSIEQAVERARGRDTIAPAAEQRPRWVTLPVGAAA